MNIAIIGVGILKGKNSHGIPAFIDAIDLLAKDNTITVYSFIPVDKNKTNIKIRCVPDFFMPLTFQYCWLGLYFLLDHFLNHYDIIHAQAPFPGGRLSSVLSRLFNIPWILSFHAGEAVAMPQINFGDLTNPYLAKLNKEVTTKAKFCLAMSHFQANDLKKNLGAKNVFVLPRGVKINQKELRTRKINTPIKFLHISYFYPVKGHRMLLRTLELIHKTQDCELIVIGKNYNEDFSSLLREYSVESIVKVLGHVDHDELINIFRQSDFLLHTSFYEGLPMVALEAMANGVVVCGTKVGIMSDLENYGITVPIGDSEGLATKILDLIQDDSAYNNLRHTAFNWVSNHDLKWYTKELTSHYKNVIAKW